MRATQRIKDGEVEAYVRALDYNDETHWDRWSSRLRSDYRIADNLLIDMQTRVLNIHRMYGRLVLNPAAPPWLLKVLHR
jgi:hypothetical protein